MSRFRSINLQGVTAFKQIRSLKASEEGAERGGRRRSHQPQMSTGKWGERGEHR